MVKQQYNLTVCLHYFCDSNIIPEQKHSFEQSHKKDSISECCSQFKFFWINLYSSLGKIMHRLPSTVHQSFPTTVVDSNSYTFRGRTSNCKPEQSRLILEDANIDGTSLSTREICHTLLTIPFIQSLKLTSVHDITPVLRKICRCNKHLEKIILKDCSSDASTEIPETVLLNMLLSLPNLRAIELNKTQFKSHMFYESVAKYAHITSINISFNEYVTLDDLMVLVHNSRLQEFKMSRRYKEPKISDLEMAHLINSLKGQLTLLHLDMSGMSNFTYNEILCCLKLIDLKLNNAINLSGDILKQLPKALIYLQHLKIEGPSLLTQQDFQNSFMAEVRFTNQLETLKLHKFDCLNDIECCNILEVCLNLKHLSLKGCKSLTIEGMYAHLLKLTNLIHLNIAFIGKSARIDSMVLYLPELKSLTIDDVSYELNQLSLAKVNADLLITRLGQKT